MTQNIDAFQHFSSYAKKYSDNYSPDLNNEYYPNHIYRLNIFLNLLNQIKPKKLLDIGCGNGEPIKSFLRAGHDAYGFDYSDEMVQQANANLFKDGFDPTRISKNNMDELYGISNDEFDCMVGLGSLYYSRNFNETINKITSLLPKNGHLIFSLRNELFSLFSLNEYTYDFYVNKLMPSSEMAPETRADLNRSLSLAFLNDSHKKKFQTTDDKKVFSTYHNPLTVNSEILKPNGLILEGIYYYHYHAMPPIFEHVHTKEFRELSAKMEDPLDWRGAFLCSTFVVHAVKE